MVQLFIDNWVREYVYELVNADQYDLVQDGTGGSKLNQIMGLLAECQLAVQMGTELPRVNHKADNGCDILYKGIRIDVKCWKNAHHRPNHQVGVYARQKDYITDVYLFCTMPDIMALCIDVHGWMRKKEFFQKATYREAGMKIIKRDGTMLKLRSADYVVPLLWLVQVNTFTDLYNIKL